MNMEKPIRPIHMMAGDSLALNGAPAFIVGHDITFENDADIVAFVATAERREVVYVETTMPSIFRLLFGGKIESRIVRETRYFTRSAKGDARG